MALTVATQLQADRLRRDTGTSVTLLPDAEVDALFTESMETYSDVASITAHTRILAIQGLLASSAKLASYKQNESSENLSDVFKHLRELLAFWQEQLSILDALAAGSAARFGRTTGIPARVKEYPGI
jgi:hypothetical protein